MNPPSLRTHPLVNTKPGLLLIGWFWQGGCYACCHTKKSERRGEIREQKLCECAEETWVRGEKLKFEREHRCIRVRAEAVWVRETKFERKINKVCSQIYILRSWIMIGIYLHNWIISGFTQETLAVVRKLAYYCNIYALYWSQMFVMMFFVILVADSGCGFLCNYANN